MSPTTLAPYRINWHTVDGEHENVEVTFGETQEEAETKARAQISDRFPCGYNPTVIITKVTEVKR